MWTNWSHITILNGRENWAVKLYKFIYCAWITAKVHGRLPCRTVWRNEKRRMWILMIKMQVYRKIREKVQKKIGGIKTKKVKFSNRKWSFIMKIFTSRKSTCWGQTPSRRLRSPWTRGRSRAWQRRDCHCSPSVSSQNLKVFCTELSAKFHDTMSSWPKWSHENE